MEQTDDKIELIVERNELDMKKLGLLLLCGVLISLTACASATENEETIIDTTENGSSKILVQDDYDKAEYDFDTLFQGYNSITTFFSDPHNMNNDDLYQYHDVDLDGKNENIVLTNLGYNGGDGGYSFGIYKEDGAELYYAEDYNVYVLFTDAGAEIHYSNIVVETLSMEQLGALYYEKGELEYFEEVYESGNIAYGDAISGAIYDEENNEYVIKSYLQGAIAHADCLGYVLVNVGCAEDGTFGVRSYSYCLDK